MSIILASHNNRLWSSILASFRFITCKNVYGIGLPDLLNSRFASPVNNKLTDLANCSKNTYYTTDQNSLTFSHKFDLYTIVLVIKCNYKKK